MRNFLPIVIAVVMVATAVTAKPPLRDVAEIDDALLELGVADIIRKNCPEISARMFRAFNFVRGIEAKAFELGYSKAEIDAYTKSKTEKARMKARGAAFFRARGVDTSDPQSYCALGRAEIQKSSRIGSLLRAK